MRPPHHAGEMMAAENRKLLAEAASMRPPHHAGEMHRGRASQARRLSRFNEAPASRGGNDHQPRHREIQHDASMRPPHHAGEMSGRNRRLCEEADASMRPPHHAGEMEGGFGAEQGVDAGFNEAPASRGGNAAAPRALFGRRLQASMRPPHHAGEMWRPVRPRGLIDLVLQ